MNRKSPELKKYKTQKSPMKLRDSTLENLLNGEEAYFNKQKKKEEI
mgnify:CR=1 FL=1